MASHRIAVRPSPSSPHSLLHYLVYTSCTSRRLRLLAIPSQCIAEPALPAFSFSAAYKFPNPSGSCTSIKVRGAPSFTRLRVWLSAVVTLLLFFLIPYALARSLTYKSFRTFVYTSSKCNNFPERGTDGGLPSAKSDLEQRKLEWLTGALGECLKIATRALRARRRARGFCCSVYTHSTHAVLYCTVQRLYTANSVERKVQRVGKRCSAKGNEKGSVAEVCRQHATAIFEPRTVLGLGFRRLPPRLLLPGHYLANRCIADATLIQFARECDFYRQFVCLVIDTRPKAFYLCSKQTRSSSV